MIKCLSSFLFLSVFACNEKSESDGGEGAFFPVSSFLKSQVASVDSSLNSITKVVTTAGVSDTTYIKREEFKQYAAEFLSLPDLSSDELSSAYTESNTFDPELQRVILNYTPRKRDQEISRQEVIIIPNPQSGDKVETVYTDKLVRDADSTVQKRLTWQVDKFLQVVTIVQKKNKAETVRVLKVTWNESF
ncbi:MAG: hypothetical protein WKF70_08170 [Chitinophagaceae bacterium]